LRSAQRIYTEIKKMLSYWKSRWQNSFPRATCFRKNECLAHGCHALFAHPPMFRRTFRFDRNCQKLMERDDSEMNFEFVDRNARDVRVPCNMKYVRT